jgi:hypothetical protein
MIAVIMLAVLRYDIAWRIRPAATALPGLAIRC